MNGRILQFEGHRHGEAQRLLPWLVNGRLDADEQAWVEQHVAGCSECRREYDAQRALQTAWLQSDDAATDGVDAKGMDANGMWSAADAGWHRLRPRLQPPQVVQESIQLPLHRQWPQRPRWMGWALAAQALMITVLGAALWRLPSVTPSYRTLGTAPAAAAGNLVIVFDPHLDEGRLRGLLRASEARIVDGPNAAGAYVLAVPAPRLAMVRDTLRAAPGVTLVATLGPERKQ